MSIWDLVAASGLIIFSIACIIYGICRLIK